MNENKEKLDQYLEEIKEEHVDAETNRKRKKVKLVGTIILIITLVLTTLAFINGYFNDTQKFNNLLNRFGIFAPIIFIIIQAFLTVFPVSPSAITNIAVVMAYGPIIGFVLNYIAIMIGSIVNFYLGRKYGKKFIGLLFDDETINKQIDWLNRGNKVEIMFIIVLIVPFLPDDISCMICGMTDFKFKRFMIITSIIKVWAIAAMLYIMINGYQALFNIIY